MKQYAHKFNVHDTNIGYTINSNEMDHNVTSKLSHLPSLFLANTPKSANSHILRISPSQIIPSESKIFNE